MQDLLDPKILRQKLELAVTEKNVWLERVYDLEPFDVEDVVSTHLGFAERLAPYVADTSLLVDRTLRAGERVLFEGAQGTLLDLGSRDVPVRHLVEPDRGRRSRQLRDRAESHRGGARRGQGVRDARR